MFESKFKTYLFKILAIITYCCVFLLGAATTSIIKHDACSEFFFKSYIATVLIVFSLCCSFALLKKIFKEDIGEPSSKTTFAIDYLELEIKTELDRVKFGNETEEDNSYQYILVSIFEAKKHAEKDGTLTKENFSHIEKLLEDDNATLFDAYSNILNYLHSIKD